MKRFLCIAVACLAAMASSAHAGWFCGAANYSCCPVAACQPTACYTACRVERQTCYRTVNETVWEPQTVTCNRQVQEVVCEDVEQTEHGLILLRLEHRGGKPRLLRLLQVHLRAPLNKQPCYSAELLGIRPVQQYLPGLEKGDDLVAHPHGHRALA